jgi:hypothetical protein
MTKILKKENTFGLLRKKKTSVKKKTDDLITAEVKNIISNLEIY